MENKQKVKALLDTYKDHWVSDEEKAGIMLSNYFGWNGLAILKVTYSALEDSNFHKDNEKIAKLIAKYK